MRAQELKHMARLAEWKEKVALCRSSGQTVRAWCQEQGIGYKTYYYWEKEVLNEAGRQIAVAGEQMAASGRWAGNRFIEVASLPERPAQEEKPALAAKLRTKLGELEVYAGADAAAVAALVQVLKDAQ